MGRVGLCGRTGRSRGALLRGGLVVVLVAVGVFAQAADGAAPVLRWSPPRLIDQGPGGAPQVAYNVSCPSATLCVGVSGGTVLTSTNPAAGAGSWMPTVVDSAPLSTISCPSVSLCVAVDNDGRVLTSRAPAGGPSAWKSARVGSSPYPDLVLLACASTTFCLASDDAGDVFTSTDPAGGAAAWSAPVGPVAGTDSFSSISCPSRSLCVASVYQARSGTLMVTTHPLQGAATWSSESVDGAPITAVSCPTERFCVAIDDSGGVVTSSDPTESSAWSAPAAIDSNRGLANLDCPTASLCVATDNSGHVVTSTDPAGGAAAWSAPVVVDPPPDCIPSHYGCAPTWAGAAVSCASEAFCVLVDHNGRAGSSSDPGANSWSPYAMSDVHELDSLSCRDARLCLATEDGTRVVSSSDPVSASKAWSVFSLPSLEGYRPVGTACAPQGLCLVYGLGAGALDSTNVAVSTLPGGGAAAWRSGGTMYPQLATDVSCPSAGLCVAVDQNGIATSTAPDTTQSWNVLSLTNVQLSGISCPSVSLCVAVSYHGNVLTSTDPTGGGSAWRTELLDTAQPTVYGVGPRAGLVGVSCPTIRFCVAIDDGGNVFSSARPTGGARAWKAVNLGGDVALREVFCPSSLLCVIGDGTGDVLTSTNPTGPAAAWALQRVDAASAIRTLACPSTALCLAGDGDGNVLIARAPGVSRSRATSALARAARQSCAKQPIAKILKARGCRTPFHAPGPGYASISWRARGTIIAVGTATTQTEPLQIIVRLTKAGHRLLTRTPAHGRVRVRVSTSFIDLASHRYEAAATMTLSR